MNKSYTYPLLHYQTLKLVFGSRSAFSYLLTCSAVILDYRVGVVQIHFPLEMSKN